MSSSSAPANSRSMVLRAAGGTASRLTLISPPSGASGASADSVLRDILLLFDPFGAAAVEVGPCDLAHPHVQAIASAVIKVSLAFIESSFPVRWKLQCAAALSARTAEAV